MGTNDTPNKGVKTMSILERLKKLLRSEKEPEEKKPEEPKEEVAEEEPEEEVEETEEGRKI